MIEAIGTYLPPWVKAAARVSGATRERAHRLADRTAAPSSIWLARRAVNIDVWRMVVDFLERCYTVSGMAVPLTYVRAVV